MTTAGTESLSDLIGDIYDAAINASRWPDVLDKVARHAGGSAAGLLSKDAVSKFGNVYYHAGVDPRFIALYQEKYWRFDPLSPLGLFAVGEVTSRLDYLSDEEFREGRFYKEWAEPQGWIDAANVVLEKSATSFAMLSVVRTANQGVVDDVMRRRVTLIVPHVRRAVAIGKAIDLRAGEAAVLADTLDGIAAGMFMLDAAARILHANAAGHSMLLRESGIRLVANRLTAIEPESDASLREAISAAGGGDTALGERGVAVPLAGRGGELFVAHVLPLTSGARRNAGIRYSAVAALFVHRAVRDAPSPPESLATAFGLTPMELRVLLAVVEVGGAPEVADALGVAESTVKTHLGRIYNKTGVRRQADLVKVVAGFANPLRS